MTVFTTEFPNLQATGYTKTSEATPAYNCIAWAAEDNSRWWWPDSYGFAFWPATAPRVASIEAFTAVFAQLGYTPCNSRNFEPGFQKIALFALDGRPTHAARQLSNGYWSSKLGQDIDIQHILDGVTGPCYGDVVQILSRPVPD